MSRTADRSRTKCLMERKAAPCGAAGSGRTLPARIHARPAADAVPPGRKAARLRCKAGAPPIPRWLHDDFPGLPVELRRSPDPIEAAVADNCRFDERAGDGRWQRFEGLLLGSAADPDAVGWQDWTGAKQLHLDRYCNVPRPSVPDAFLEINRSAWLDALSDNQTLVRIEDLNRPLQASVLDLDGLKDLLQRADGGEGDAGRAVQLFFERWNQRRDARPAFAAFYDEVQHESDDDDWPHTLRDRLGLGHYGLAAGAPLPVALMRYPLADVYSAQVQQRLPSACALPAVLDDGMHEFFFPVPREHPYGATLHLQPDQADTLTAEIVHCRIDYRREHLHRLGTITRPHRLDGSRLREARDLHLLTLQEECGREDFGELLEGRT